jgi:hypothetical protein
VAARRPAHKVGHAVCPYGATSWAQCDDLARDAYGRCSALTAKAEECEKYAVPEAELNGRRYCNQHATAIAIQAAEFARQSKLKVDLDRRITSHLAWIAEHPSVWDNRSDGGGGESNPALPEVEGPGTETVSAGPTGPAKPLTPVVWSASSGVPAPLR